MQRVATPLQSESSGRPATLKAHSARSCMSRVSLRRTNISVYEEAKPLESPLTRNVHSLSQMRRSAIGLGGSLAFMRSSHPVAVAE